MRTLISSIGFVVIATLAPPLEAQAGAAVVGKKPDVAGAAQTVKVTATIAAIDAGTRTVTLLVFAIARTNIDAKL